MVRKPPKSYPQSLKFTPKAIQPLAVAAGRHQEAREKAANGALLPHQIFLKRYEGVAALLKANQRENKQRTQYLTVEIRACRLGGFVPCRCCITTRHAQTYFCAQGNSPAQRSVGEKTPQTNYRGQSGTPEGRYSLGFLCNGKKRPQVSAGEQQL